MAYKLSPLGKLFIANVIAWMVNGVRMNWKIKGEKGKVMALASAIVASKKFQDELKKKDATVESVIDKLNIKNMSAKEFEKLTGFKFPL